MSVIVVLGVLLYLVLLFPLTVVVFDSVCRLAFLVIASCPNAYRDPPQATGRDLRLLLLVLAHNEEKSIERTLVLLRDEAVRRDNARIAVLADYCTDRTASIAAGMGALVYSREEGEAGKSQALSWFVHEAGELLSATDLVAVLDADTRIRAGFCDAICAAFVPDVQAVQGFVNPVSQNGFPLTTLISLSEILSEKVDDAARSRLRWSVPLRGTGMAFRTKTFLAGCERLGTQVDDIELSVRLAERGIRTFFEPKAVVDDPKSDQALGLARQRGRWLRGQRQVWRMKGRTIAKLLRAGPPNWSLIQALLLKPKTALVIIRLILVAAFWVWSFPYTILQSLAFYAALAGLLIDAVYYLSGLRFTRETGKYLASLLISPVLLALWAMSWTYSLLPTQEWLRAQER